MAEESHQEKNADCTDVQPVTWNQIDLIIQKISTFLGPSDLSSFRLVCKKWKDESSPSWEYHRMCHTLNRFARLAKKFVDEIRRLDVSNQMPVSTPSPKLLTVFSEYRPPRKDCDFDCVGAEDLRNFFQGAKKDDHWKITQLKNTGLVYLKLRKWNCFGVFPSGQQEGAKWFLNEIADKVKHLSLDVCNLSISQKEFFPTLCQLKELEELIIRGTYFQLRPSFPVEPTLDEISPLLNLQQVEMNYENCTLKQMPNYNFPWNVFLRAFPKDEPGVIMVFSYSNRSNLDFTIQQFSKMMAAAKKLKKEEMVKLCTIFFKDLSKANSKEAVILEKDVMRMVSKAMKKLRIRDEVISQACMRNYQQSFKYRYPEVKWKPKFDMTAYLQSSKVYITFFKCGNPEDEYCPPYWNNIN